MKKIYMITLDIANGKADMRDRFASKDDAIQLARGTYEHIEPYYCTVSSNTDKLLAYAFFPATEGNHNVDLSEYRKYTKFETYTDIWIKPTVFCYVIISDINEDKVLLKFQSWFENLYTEVQKPEVSITKLIRNLLR